MSILNVDETHKQQHFRQPKVHLHSHKDYIRRLCLEQLANISHFSARLAEKKEELRGRKN